MPPPAQRRRSRLLTRWWSILLLATLVPLLLAIGAAAGLSKMYWGYVLSPPGVDPRVLHATKVVAYSGVGADQTSHQYVPPSDEIDERTWPRSPINFALIASVRNTDHTWRLLSNPVDPAAWERDWLSRGVMPTIGSPPKIAPDRITSLRSLIESTASPVSGEWGNGLGEPPSGAQIFQLLGPAGEPLLFVSLNTGQLSNDHLAYYELLYDDSTTPPTLLDRRQWYFDVAGLEGAEFVPLSIVFSILGLMVTLPFTAAALAYGRFSKGARIARGRCPRCNYDLRADFSRGCSECGWGAGPSAGAERDLFQYTLRGRLLRMITRPPRWRTLLVLAVSAALVWYGRSMPGEVPWAVYWGRLLLIAAVCFCFCNAVGTIASRAKSDRRWRMFARFAVAAAIVLLGSLALFTDWPLHWRFALSRNSLERTIARERAAGYPNRAPVGMNAIAGLYRVGGVVPTTDSGEGAVVWVGSAGGSPMRGFVWYPGSRPASASAYRTPIDLWARLDAHWYLWDYVRKPGKPVGE